MNYAGFFRRLQALIIDNLILLIPGLFVGSGFHDFSISIGAHFIIGFLYYPFFESSVLNATPGKALSKIAVLTENGERLSFKAAAIRFLTRYISLVICYIGYLMQPFTAKKQALHDILSETIVIERASEDLNYFTVWKDQFKEVVNRL